MQSEPDNNPELNNNQEPVGVPEPAAYPGIPEAASSAQRRWGAWPTIGLGLAVLTIYILAQNIVAVVFTIVTAIEAFTSGSQLNILEYVKSLNTNGLLISIATLVSVALGLFFIFIFIKIRKGFSWRAYLELNPISKKTALILLAVIVGVLLLSSLVDRFLPQQDNSFVIDSYKTAGWLPLFWVSVVVFAPIFEESLFRGFLFVGLRQSIIGPIGTIILTAAVFAGLHALQYNSYSIAAIFILGIIIGVVRHISGSLWSAILLHAAWNLLQLVAVAFYVK